jgi:TonB dependent receptor.
VIYNSTPTSFKATKHKLDPVNNLSLGATYNLFKGVSIFARINNLLNQDYQYSYSYPVQGINFLGGLSFQF